MQKTDVDHIQGTMSWSEFQQTGLLFLVNQVLTAFGVAIAAEIDKKTGAVLGVFPTRVTGYVADPARARMKYAAIAEFIASESDRLCKNAKTLNMEMLNGQDALPTADAFKKAIREQHPDWPEGSVEMSAAIDAETIRKMTKIAVSMRRPSKDMEPFDIQFDPSMPTDKDGCEAAPDESLSIHDPSFTAISSMYDWAFRNCKHMVELVGEPPLYELHIGGEVFGKVVQGAWRFRPTSIYPLFAWGMREVRQCDILTFDRNLP